MQDVSKVYRNYCGADKISHGFLPTNATTVENFLHGQINIKNMESCSGVPGIVYNFNNKNLVTFEDNFGAKGDYQ